MSDFASLKNYALRIKNNDLVLHDNNLSTLRNRLTERAKLVIENQQQDIAYSILASFFKQEAIKLGIDISAMTFKISGKKIIISEK
jgi:hypothetical protein